MIVNWILAFATSALLVLIYPHFSFVWLAPVALTPLIIACAREDRWRWRFALGYAAGFAYWFGLCSWIHETLSTYAGVGPVGAWLLFALLCLAKSIQMGAFAALAGPVLRSPIAVPAVAALWVAIEWTHAPTGFTWLNLGNAGSDMDVVLRLAPITGVWGMSFAFAMMSAAVAWLIMRLPRAQIAWLLLLLALYFLPENPAPQRGNASAILVQPNISDDAVWTQELRDSTERQLTMTSLAPVLNGEGRVDLIVWPEMPAPFYDYDPEFTTMVSRIAKTSRAPILTGVVAQAADKMPLNSALLTGADGKIVSRYDKVHLVPFGEFVPWPLGALTKKVSSEAGDFAPGRDVVVSSIGTGRIGTFICYESVFPGYVRRFVTSGAQVLINISNDAWYGKSEARRQHLEIVRMRAAENHRWILRATNNGITAAIDPAGRVIRTANEYEEIAARYPFRYRDDQTIYTRFGDWFVLLSALIAAAGFVWGRVR